MPVIIGGGIAGLYTALKLVDKGEANIVIYEARERLGGHIFTHYGEDYHVEAGAGRFTHKHKFLLKLLKRFNLTAVPLSTEKWYAPILCPGKRMEDPSDKLFAEVFEYAKRYTTEDLLQITFEQLCIEALGATKANILEQAYGYDSDFKSINAYVSLKDFKEEDPRYFICAEGLGELVKRMVDYLLVNNVKIYMQRYVQDVLYKDGTYTVKFVGHRSIKTQTLMLAIPSSYLKELSLFTEYQKALLDTVETIPLHRIYAKESRPLTTIRTTTDLPLRQYIPVYPEKGIAMVAYTDVHYADYWKAYADQGIKKLSSQLLNQLKLLFPKDPPKKFEWILSFYWKEGIHTWKVGAHPKKVRKELKAMYPGLMIVGESYSMHQAWIEGALETVEDGMATMNGGGSSSQQWVTLTVPGEKQKRKIDVSEWMYLHPGGKEPYLQNMNKDVTDKFKKIPNHFDENGKLKEHVLAAIKKYTI